MSIRAASVSERGRSLTLAARQSHHMRIEILDLHKHYGKTRAVDGITFAFESGQIFGFVGPNGAGKSTTMRMLATLEEPTQGDAQVDGVSLVEDPGKAHKLVGYVPDALPENRDISVDEYLDFFARSYGLWGSKRRRVVQEIEEFTNLGGIKEKHVNALSKGMKNRVSVARALVHNPPVLIMDEPASGLDPRARIELRELLRVLAAQGKAILISSHILTELAEICTGAVFIERGKILQAGTLDQLLSQHVDQRTVVIRSLAPVEQLYKHLLVQPGVEAVRLIDQAVEVDVAGSDDACCELLKRLILDGYRILEFRPRRADLEQIFMTVTKGDVA
jgi:ABC-2 type transport system ATP-binding protein